MKKLAIFAILVIFAQMSFSQDSVNKGRSKKKKRGVDSHKWVNPLSEEETKLPGLSHATFKSKSMGINVGYCIYLPPQYKTHKSKKFPVVYFLHGGFPGSETKCIRLVPFIDKVMKNEDVEQMIYVFVNGGPMSHYNYPQKENGQGEDIFIKELIPHIDSTYRTVSDKMGRGIEGFSMGGRGTARIMFKHPHLFYSCSPGGAGYGVEKELSEKEGKISKLFTFKKGYNAYDLAREFKKKKDQNLKILFYVGLTE